MRALGSTGAHPTCVSPETGVTHAKDLLQESQSAWKEEPRPTQGRWDHEEILGERAVQRPCSKMFLACMGTGSMQLEQSELGGRMEGAGRQRAITGGVWRAVISLGYSQTPPAVFGGWAGGGRCDGEQAVVGGGGQRWLDPHRL